MTLVAARDKLWKFHCSAACAVAALHAHNRANPRQGSLSPSWKGGRGVTAKGYVRIHAPDHPRAGSRGSVFEHILVMEAKIGRFLRPGEEVHHVNGDRADNRPENLELWFVRRQPKGVRLSEVPHCPTCRC